MCFDETFFKMAENLEAFHIDISHQEVERILCELEQMFSAQPLEWLPLESTSMFICADLGYEDMNEFEDAIKGDFESFLKCFPHIEVAEIENKKQFRIKEQTPKEPVIYTINVKERSDLWRVVLKSPSAVITIPSLEFEMLRESKRRIDSIYNHIGNAIFNLGLHYRRNISELSESDQNMIADTLNDLNILLDVEEPWILKIIDPSGMSEVFPFEGVNTEEYNSQENETNGK
eukprot:GHVL01010941.1.p2 GENE.GHVL01010941.1~~GHVL01010941.1.p2  ORF type:complete len:232 (-),score=52.24 GHVL01010941.1:1456-2151(-)